MKSKLTAVIPARKFDKLIPNKNILPIGDVNLLELKISQLKKVRSIDSIIVTTDSNEIKNICKGHDVQVIKRINHEPESESFNELVFNTVSQIESEYILWTSVVTPFINEITLQNGIDKFYDSLSQGFDSLISVRELRRNIIGDNGPINFNFYDNNIKNQIILFEFILGFSIASSKKIKEWKYNWGDLTDKFLLNSIESIQICDFSDYEIAKLIYENK